MINTTKNFQSSGHDYAWCMHLKSRKALGRMDRSIISIFYKKVMPTTTMTHPNVYEAMRIALPEEPLVMSMSFIRQQLNMRKIT